MADRIDLKRSLNELAFRQAGYFTAHQARSVGYSYQAQKYHSDRGNWTRIDRALYRLADWPSDALDLYTRWYVWSERRGVISHESAAAIHDLGDLDPGKAHLTMTCGTTSIKDSVVIHHANLPAYDVESRPSFDMTTPTRTVFDLAVSDLPQDQLNGVVSDAIAGHSVRRRVLQRRMDEFGDSAALRLERAIANAKAIDP